MWPYRRDVPRRHRITAATVRGPRKYLRSPEDFGVTDPAEPARLPRSQEHLVRAALQQHALAREAVEQIRRLDLDYETLASQLGISTEQLRRLLRGESAMSVERMHQLAKAVALKMTVTVERTE